MNIDITGKIIPSGTLAKRFVQGESNMEKIQFTLPLRYGGVDMSALNYTLRLANVAGTVTSAAMKKAASGDQMALEWTVTEDFTRMPGNCRIEIDGVDGSGAHKFKAVSAWFDVVKNLGSGSNLPPKDEITKALEDMQAYLSEAADRVDDATEQAEAAQGWSNTSKGYAEESKKWSEVSQNWASTDILDGGRPGNHRQRIVDGGRPGARR